MFYRVLALLIAAIFTFGCTTTSTRDRAFTDDWADHTRGKTNANRRSGSENTETKGEQRLGPATITRDEAGRPQVNLGGAEGLGADVQVQSGGSARLRYRRQWDFVRPERRN